MINKEIIIKNAMTVDVEDYFQVSAFEQCIHRSDWDKLPHRVEQNTHKILDLFATAEINSTFFVLGWVAERYPSIINRIIAEGHELASHGYAHQRATQQTRGEFRKDIHQAKVVLEDLSGVQIKGYRAPSYSISKENLWAHDELFAEGYVYSSSVYPIHHDLYGIPDASRFSYQCQSGLLEIPVSTVKILNKNFPAGGGGFFRLYPYFLSRWNINQINRTDNQSVIFYFHPWEIDPTQPRQNQASLKSRFRHYLNLHRTEARLKKLLLDFQWGRMDEIFLTC
jgi:polysaccharide deacetylase family protein (PEP-CTERM system associated)